MNLKVSERRHGFTLLELVVSLGASSVLMAGLASALVVSLRLNDKDFAGVHSVSEASEIAFELQNDLVHATQILTTTDSVNAIELLVPDRNYDTVDETIRYEWSGVAGDPILKSINDGASFELTRQASLFEIDFDLRELSSIGDVEESDDQTWISQTSSLGFYDYKVESSKGIGTFFVPSLPSGASTWSVTSVSVKCSQAGTELDGEIAAKLFTADSNGFPVTLIDRTDFLETELPASMGWYTFFFTSADQINAGQRVSLIFLKKAGEKAAMKMGVLDQSYFSASTGLLKTSNNGASWDQVVFDDLPVIIHGKYITAYTDEHYFAEAVTVQIQVDDNDQKRVRTVIRPRNLPEVDAP